VLGLHAGKPPALDLDAELALHRLLVAGAREDVLAVAHDCGDGGMAIALAECAIWGGHGFAVTLAGDLPPHVLLFSESASRAVVAVAPEREYALGELAGRHGVPLRRLGETGGPRAMFAGILEATVQELREAYEGAIPQLMGR